MSNPKPQVFRIVLTHFEGSYLEKHVKRKKVIRMQMLPLVFHLAPDASLGRRWISALWWDLQMILNRALDKHEQQKCNTNDPKWGRLEVQAGNNMMGQITTREILNESIWAMWNRRLIEAPFRSSKFCRWEGYACSLYPTPPSADEEAQAADGNSPRPESMQSQGETPYLLSPSWLPFPLQLIGLGAKGTST